MHEEKRAGLERVATIIVDAGLQVHRALGPGLLESAYEHCLCYELQDRGLSIERQVCQSISYRGATLDAGYRLDLMVEHAIVIEVKAVEAVTSLHQAQLLTYLKLSGCPIGFLMNFHVPLFKQGLKRLVI
jgi:GxxExxY protein